MPNMLGGSQHHPDYDPRTEIQSNQVLIGRDLYTVDEKTLRVNLETVNGSLYEDVHTGHLPVEVKQIINRLNSKFNNNVKNIGGSQG